MRKVLLLVLVLISGYSYGQVYQQMSQYGVEFKRMDNDSVLRIPRGLGSLRSISGYDTAQIRYNVSDSSVYVHTGNNWIKAIRATDADSSVFATVHKLYTTIDSLGSLIVSENLGNSNLTQSDPTRTYDGDGGELSFSNLSKFKVSASDSAIIKSSNIYGTATNSFIIDSIGGMILRKYGPDAVVTIVLDEIQAILNSENNDDTSNLLVAHNGISMISSNHISLTADSIVITQTPPTLTTDYDVLVRDENTGKVGIATISGADSTIFSTNYRRDTAIANVRGAIPLSDNPTASLGLSAVNGSATTYMRSDAAPALSQSIAPTWTGLHTYRKDAIGSSITESIRLENTTAATSGNPQFSPYMSFIGRWYNTTGGTSNISNIRIFNRTFSTVNTNFPAELAFQTAFDGSTFKDAITLSAGNMNPILKILNNGELQVNNITANNNLLITFGNPFYVTSSSTNAIIGALYIGGNPSYINSSAALHINSTTKGFLPPIMTATQRNAISSPASGLLVHNTDSTKLSIYDNGRWNQIPKVLINTATLDFGSTSAQSSADLTITVTGAADGDMVSLGVTNAATLTNSSYTAWVSAADTVTVRFNNYSSGSQDPASATFKVQVFK